MSAITDTGAETDMIPGGELEVVRAHPGPRITETYWGYVIQEEQDRFDRETMGETALRFLGLILVMSAYGLWLLPAVLFPGDPFIMKAGMALIFATTGIVLYWYASRGLSIDIHVDTSRRELRVSHRNSRGQTRVHSAIPMRRIESAYIRRSKTPGAASQLFIRFRDRSEVLHVADGTDEDLEALHRRLAADLRPVSDRVNHRLANSLPFRSRRSSEALPPPSP